MPGAVVSIRPAEVGDVSALARLRILNAEVHVALEPEVYRIPDARAVTAYFLRVLDSPHHGRETAVFVAEGAGTAPASDLGSVLGSVEVVPAPPYPDHQVLQPVAVAHVHTVVALAARGRGIGRRLVDAAVDDARRRGIDVLVAGIAAANAPALAFYAANGFSAQGQSWTRHLRAEAT